MKKQLYQVNLVERSYDIHIEAACLDAIGAKLRQLFQTQTRCLLVSNETIAPLYAKRVQESLEQAGWHVDQHLFPDGEKYKTLEHWSALMDTLMQSKISRSEPIIALGGGVVGDMTGFAASCYRRGIPFIQVPTTLLAQVDSSVGGKTAVNHPHGKNMVGAFYQPKLVWIDPLVLQTLEVKELRAGIAELIKYGLIRDVAFFEWLYVHIEGMLSLDADTLAYAIYHSCRHKAEVVMADETEQGMRALLNLGHTFGHAIESMTHYESYLHGEAVALGTIMAARLSEQLGFAVIGLEKKILSLYVQAGLNTVIPQFSAEQWIDAMGHDKKNVGSRIRYILMRDIGDAFIAEDVDNASIVALVDSFSG
ncbi:MAG: 3-dehydroquinate synthase [Mariprofundaceae bacterium]|nr:3-dehydroquinate synthase [Mariprofundaceae bacterium]